ncbi:type II toxin-antitoxin system HicB family antitoxin [Pelotomaculum isophthalicicum JI]|uniref:Type II toxin-antitoxin system HicB family antitoxin n=1 Tax=Pelotomaculum isophthalicicum JI TaxID=947010 RepID=A0A9X4H436_9FIRM|nr:type II toxin-antitoxin system HicB family antitoxin [Pelotomaculum isophthalicicum]MDF9406998.1 type II toxin-antitoxin system HicB family antitoxin [Pelotomaculum isophthalicicum JI]
MNKDLQYYLGLPYQVTLHPSADGGYAVEIPELPGCISQGQTVEEALKMIEDAKICWLETALEESIEIPEPARESDDYSGKLNIRIPKSLHRTLVEKAKDEKVSLNQYIMYQLARSAGHPIIK